MCQHLNLLDSDIKITGIYGNYCSRIYGKFICSDCGILINKRAVLKIERLSNYISSNNLYVYIRFNVSTIRNCNIINPTVFYQWPLKNNQKIGDILRKKCGLPSEQDVLNDFRNPKYFIPSLMPGECEGETRSFFRNLT